ncbi:MAG: nuclear transport factor 2 family protein [Paracoccaceae bacterium]|nr:nuclear transport factor 2 family protein [Paracoccaceae bacterium]
MTEPHPNVALLMQLDLRDLDASAPLFSDDFVWHFYNPKLPDLQGDYHGVDGLKRFFAAMAGKTQGSFNVQPVSVTPVGNELLVVHVRDVMVLEGAPITTDAVVVWRIVNGQIAEAWDIPAVYAVPDG